MILLSLVLVVIDISKLIVISMEPLSLKSEPGCNQDRKSSLISASQLILKFSLKSPSSRVCLTDRDTPSARSVSISTPRVMAQQHNLFKKAKERKAEGVVLPLKRRDENVKTNSSDCRDKLVKMVNQSKRKEQGKVKALPLQNMLNGKENKCLTERSTPKASSSFKFNICLDAKASLPRQTKENNEQNVQRKCSDASTLSLKTKHTASLHNHQQDGQLFQRHSSEQLEDNIMRALQAAKRKLYQQIYSLDRKLLDDYPLQQHEAPSVLPKKKQTITISLKKKDPLVDCSLTPQ